MQMNLADLNNGDQGIILKIKGHGAFRKRIVEMGFVKGKVVSVIKRAPLQDPVEYNIMGYHVSLRTSEARQIEVLTPEEAKKEASIPHFEELVNGELWTKIASEKTKTINVALVGNPNCGKTTLFNYVSGSREHVGNYGGVTIDSKLASVKYKGYTINITDLPGTYSLSSYSPEELFVREHIINQKPDLIVNVVDGSNLERNLYLTTQLIDMDQRIVIALNMYDELDKSKAKFNIDQFSKLLGCAVIPTVGSKGRGINSLFDKVIQVFENQEPNIRHVHINYGKLIEKAIQDIQTEVKKYPNIIAHQSPRFLSIKLLEDEQWAKNFFLGKENSESIFKLIKEKTESIQKSMNEDSSTVLADSRYGYVAGALKECFEEGIINRRKRTDFIDTFLTHKIFGFPIFLFFMFVMFFATFQIGQFPVNWIENGVDLLGNLLKNHMAEGPFKDLLVDGIIGGVGGVIVFLPNILILFLFISFMEDTGYMARAAFIMDKIMHRIGLHGKSFIPLIMGFGCNVPAIMATRTIENRNERLLTILINPLMSCSARLPVYILFIGAFFPENPSTILFLIYLTGILLATVMARLFRKTIIKADELPFVMELPPYRLPTFRTTLIHMWEKGNQYLRKMGGIILVASIIIWALGYFPRQIEYTQDYDRQIISLNQQFASATSEEKPLLKDSIQNIQFHKKQEHQEKSYIGIIGKFIQPVMAPLGFDWKTSVSLLAGITAKEIVVSTLGVLYTGNSENNNSLTTKLQNETRVKKGKTVPLFELPVAIAFILFVLVYFPCIAVIAAIRREAGSWKWALFTIFYTTTLAWIIAFIANSLISLIFY